MGRKNEDIIISNQIKDLAKVHISPNLIDNIDIKKLSEKAVEIVNKLDESKKTLKQISNQEWYEIWKRWGGQNDKKIANAEKAVLDATKFNVGLSCMLVLFSKAIKAQQDEILEHNEQIEKQQEDIRKLQGLTKEQADEIVKILSAKDYLVGQVNKVREDILKDMDEKINLVEKKLGEDIISSNKQNRKNITAELEKLRDDLKSTIQNNETKLIEIRKLTNSQFLQLNSKIKIRTIIFTIIFSLLTLIILYQIFFMGL